MLRETHTFLFKYKKTIIRNVSYSNVKLLESIPIMGELPILNNYVLFE